MVPSLNTGHPSTSPRRYFIIRAYSVKELLALYNISSKRFARILSPYRDLIGPMQGRTYSPLQVERILACIGTPRVLDVTEMEPLQD
ncbi:MAG: hypothetical protein JWQ27_2321 [Ferruginibacter sp.]|nr:hypothetical protein [Ferruginibacter sp.]